MIKFIREQGAFFGRTYRMEIDGVVIGYAHAKVSSNATGMHKVRGTSYSAVVDGVNYSGSRASLVRDITRARARMAADVSVYNHGSLIGLTIKTPAAKEWTNEHLPDDAQWLGNIVYVEPRYVDCIIAGMQGDGLSVV